ncbi:MAG: cytochrome c biogenesis protein ResB, partial [Sciscionella sp.]
MQTERAATPQPQPPRNPLRSVLAFARNTWRGLTSMRTALVLLFLLALGAMPGALLPQRDLNASKVATYISQHGWWGQLLDKLEFFNVYSSVWFSAIYILLFVSLVGCLTPRTFEYAGALRTKPVLTPRNLARMPHHASGEVTGEVAEVATGVKRRLKGWRLVTRDEGGGVLSISAEKGYLREAGNLIFHFAMLGLIVCFALGAMYKYKGQVIVQAIGGDSSQFCNSGIYNFDSFTPGLRVDGTNLPPFCVKVNDFTAHYTPSGDADYYDSHIDYQYGNDLQTGTWRPYNLEVNHPLRIVGDRIYLLGNGYTPVFTVTFPNGEKRTGATQWKPDDPTTMLSEGATKFDAPGVTDPAKQRKDQLAITGLFAPSAAFSGSLMSSDYPGLRNPAVAVDIYRGDLGTDAGNSQSIFSIDQSMVDQGRLHKVERTNLKIGQSTTLKDGTVVRFDKVQPWVSLEVAHDPTQDYVLIFAILMLLGLGTSLTIKRRRLWVRLTPGESTGTVVSVGGLARTDQAGYG